MATVELRVDDFEDGVLPQVCASSGRPTGSLYRFRARRAVWWPLLLLFAGPIGVVAMIVVMQLLGGHVAGWVPLDDDAHGAMRTARRRAVWRLVEVGLAIGGVVALFAWLRWTPALVAVVVVGAAALGWCVATIARPAGSIGLRWERSGRIVTLTDASEEFVKAYRSQEARRIRRRFDDIADPVR